MMQERTTDFKEANKFFNSLFRNLSKSESSQKKINLAFYTFGNIANCAVSSITDSSDLTKDYIDNIFLIGKENEEKSSIVRRQRFAEQFNQKESNHSKVISYRFQDLEEIISKTDLFFFTAAKPSDDKSFNRANMNQTNIELIDNISRYFNEGFNGLINIMSNTPEVLAHYAAQTFKLRTPRQITAHGPLDLIRYKSIINKLLGEKIKGCKDDLDLNIVGYHDLVWPILSTARICTNRTINDKGELTIEYVPLEKEIRNMSVPLGQNRNIQEYLMQSICSNAYELVHLFNKEISNYREQNPGGLINFRDCPTAEITGSAIRNFVRAFAEGGRTTAAVPYEIDGKYFFVDLPVSFSNNFLTPVVDEHFLDNLTEIDKEKLKEIVLSDRIFNIRTKQGIQERKSLSSLLDECGIKKNLEVKEDSYLKKTSQELSKKVKDNTYFKLSQEGVIANFIDDIDSMKQEIESLKEQLDSSSSRDRKYLKKDLKNAEKEVKQQKSFKERLTETLNTQFYLFSAENSSFYNISFQQSLKPSLVKHTIDLSSKFSKEELERETQKLRILCLISNQDLAYVLTSRLHKISSSVSIEDYRLCLFDKNRQFFISEKFKSKTENFDLNEFVVDKNERIFFIKDEEKKNSVVEYLTDKNSFRTIFETDKNIHSLLSNNGDLILSESDKVYELKGSDLSELFQDSRLGFNRRTLLEEENLFFYSVPEENKFFVFDLDSRKSIYFYSERGQFNYNYSDGKIQLILSEYNSTLVQNYESKHDLFSKKADSHSLDGLISSEKKLLIPNQNIIIVNQAPNLISLVYHEKDDFYKYDLRDIRNFKNGLIEEL